MSSLRLEVRAVRGNIGPGVLLAAALLAAVAPARADGLRPAVALPLQAAEKDLARSAYTAALAKVAQAAAAPGKTATETLTIDQVRAAVDAGRGDRTAAAADYAAIIATGALPPAQVAEMAQAESSLDYQTGNYGGAIATIKTYLRDDAQFTPILLQAYEKLGQCDALDRQVMKMLPPPQADLQLAAYCYGTAKDTAGYLGVIQTMVQYYPAPAYWSILLGQKQVQPEFSDRLALDFFRLKLAVGAPATEPEYMDMTQAAVQAGLLNEAAAIMAAGDASGVLGSGPDAARQARLKALVSVRRTAKQAAPASDQPALFAAGFNQVDGGNPAGLPVMAAAIRSGGMPQAGQAELEMGMAYREAGQKANAEAMWHGVQGGDGAAELAQLWSFVR